jgi:pimeloyl-[acyl-carrier protein] methyl ester esterase
MLNRFAESPREVLADFRRRCGEAQALQDLDRSRLESDLRLLRDADERARSAAWRLPMLSLQADDDPILPSGLREAAFGGAPLLRRVGRPDGGHLLPVTQPGWCAAQIRSLLAELT